MVAVHEPPIRPAPSPRRPAAFERLADPAVKLLLRSPLHGLLSDSRLTVAVTDRQSGSTDATLHRYERMNGALYVTTPTDRTWWRDLRGGARVTVRLRGERREGRAEVFEDRGAIAEYVYGYLLRHGTDAASRIGLAVDGDEVPDREALRPGLADVVVVRIALEG